MNTFERGARFAPCSIFAGVQLVRNGFQAHSTHECNRDGTIDSPPIALLKEIFGTRGAAKAMLDAKIALRI